MISILKKIKTSILLSLLIGIPATILFELFPEIILKYIYNTNQGINYLKVLAPIALFHYIQSPLTASLQAMGKAKEGMIGTLEGTILRLITLYIFSSIHIGMWGLIIAISTNIIYVTLHQGLKIKQTLKKGI